MRPSLLDRLAPVAFVLGLMALVFGWGFLAGKHRLFPGELMNGAEDGARGVWQAYIRPPPFDRPAREGTPAESGVTVRETARVAPGVTFVTGYTRDGFAAWIVDQEGRRLHDWRATFSQIFGERAPQLQWQPRDITIAWHGAHLFPNGDILFNFQDNGFPYGSGLVKLDKDSRMVWKLPLNTHHDVTVMEDGTIWVPSQHFRPEGLPGFPNLEPGYYEDTVLEVSPAGEVRREISMMEAVRPVPGLVGVVYGERAQIRGQDLLHLNNVEPLTPAMAAAFPMFTAGDLLVSFRNPNTIAVVSPQDGRVKWIMHGPFVRQHDPDFLPNGNIMVFDNLGGDPACGGSRILEIEPVSQDIVWRYDGCGGKPFMAETRGEQTVLGNGNVLTFDTQGGRVFEVTHSERPEIVWEYHNVLQTDDGAPRVGLITHASRHPREALTFLPPAS